MAPRATVNSRDLTVHFFDKSFKIKGMMHQCIYTGRRMDKQEMMDVVTMLQSLIERGRHGNNWREFSKGHRPVVHSREDMEDWQAQEIANLNDQIEELKCDIADYESNIGWWEANALPE